MKKPQKVSEMTDREVQESIALNMRAMVRSNESTKGWVTFLGIITLLGIIGTLIAST